MNRSGEADTVTVELGVMLSTSHNAPLALVSSIEEVDYRLSSCASGDGSLFKSGSRQSLTLYKSDRSCVVGLDRVKIAGVNYIVPAGISFNTEPYARTPLQSSSGKLIYAFVQSQLPAQLTGASYTVGFILSENERGADKIKPIYELGLSVDRLQIAEGSSVAATFTLQRAVPAIGPLTVNLEYAGSALRGIDTNALPPSLQFADGQSKVSFSVTAVDDALLEASETLTVSVGLGAYLSKASPITLEILDNDLATLSFSAATLNFGARALNLPHDMTVSVTNSGTAPATAFQLQSGLTAPFFFPSGYPGEGGSCGTILDPGKTCTLTLGFNPTAVAPFNNALLFSYNDGRSTQSISLNLQGSGANVGYLKTNLGKRFDFGVGRTDVIAKKHVVIENIGAGSLSNLSLSFGSAAFGFAGGSFPGTGGSCGTSLAAASSCTLVIAYTPSSAGAVSTTLSFQYSNGLQNLTSAVLVEATASPLLADSQLASVGFNQTRAITLTATGGTGTISYIIDKGPAFGTLSGTAPNVLYKPNVGFKGLDSFTFRASDSTGPSPSAEVRLLVQPNALFIVNKPNAMSSMDLSVRSQLESKGFVVTVIDDGATSTTQALGKDLIAVSGSVSPNSILTKYRDVRLPVLIWERGLYDDMKMIASSQATGSTGNISSISVLETSSFMNRGYSLGSLNVLSSNAKLSYVSNNDSNVAKFSSVVGNPSQVLEFAYDSSNYMPGGLIAPARRLGTFYPASGGSFNSAGLARIDRNIDWTLQSPASLLYDSFQRDASTLLGNGWKELEASAGAVAVSGQRMVWETAESVVQAKNSFPIQTSGLVTASFVLDLQRSGTLATDYQVHVQLGRCDLMDNDSSNESGVAVHLIWGGLNAGLAAENSLGYRLPNSSTVSLGSLNSGEAPISIAMDLANRSYQLTSPLGSSAAIPFQNNVSIDCVKVLAKHINSQEFTSHGLHHLRIYPSN